MAGKLFLLVWPDICRWHLSKFHTRLTPSLCYLISTFRAHSELTPVHHAHAERTKKEAAASSMERYSLFFEGFMGIGGLSRDEKRDDPDWLR